MVWCRCATSVRICECGTQVDLEHSTLVAGFHDGVVRILTITQTTRMVDGIQRTPGTGCDLVLRQAFKPHTMAVTAMAYDVTGQIFATAVRQPVSRFQAWTVWFSYRYVPEVGGGCRHIVTCARRAVSDRCLVMWLV